MKSIKDLIKCFHRHTIDDGHVACFAQGNVVDRRQVMKIPWYQEEGMRIGYLDIETDGLKADFSTMLSWSLKEKDGETVYDVVTKKELFDGTTDQRIVTSLVDEMSKYKIIVGYYSQGFDLPYLRTKSLHYDIPFISYGEIYSFDLYYTVRSKLNLSRKSLSNVCDYLNLGEKTEVDKNVWRSAKYGDPGALAEVVEHNMNDVVLTERLHNKIAFAAKWTKRSI